MLDAMPVVEAVGHTLSSKHCSCVLSKDASAPLMFQCPLSRSSIEDLTKT